MKKMEKKRFDPLSYDSTQAYEAEQKKKLNNAKSAFKLPPGVEWFKLPEETSFIRVDILPFVTTVNGKETLLPRLPYATHRLSLASGYRQFICPREYEGEDCPICAFCRGLYNVMKQDREKEELYKKISVKLRQLYAIRWLDAPSDEQDKIWILDQATYGFGKLLDNKISGRDTSDPDEAKWDRFADLYEGYHLKLSLAPGIWQGNSFVQITGIDLKPRKTQYYDDSWYDKIPDLRTIPQKADPEELQKAVEELSSTFLGRRVRPDKPTDNGYSNGDNGYPDPSVIERPDDENNIPW